MAFGEHFAILTKSSGRIYEKNHALALVFMEADHPCQDKDVAVDPGLQIHLCTPDAARRYFSEMKPTNLSLGLSDALGLVELASP